MEYIFLMMMMMMKFKKKNFFFLMVVLMILWEKLWIETYSESFIMSSMDNTSYILVLMLMWLINLVSMTGFEKKNMIFILSFMMLTLMLCFMSISMMKFFIFFEISMIPMLYLIFIFGAQMERVKAGIYMMMYTLMGSLPLFVMIWYFYQISMMNMIMLKVNMTNWIMVLIMLSFLIKLPIYIFHIWLPKAHVEAPIEGSMILAGVLLKLGGYGLYRMNMYLLMYKMNYMMMLLVMTSIIGSMIIGLICLNQVDLKMLVAYSSVCHMSYVVLGYFSGSNYGANGSLLMMVSHGLCSSIMFYMVNMLYERYFTRNMMLLKGMNLLMSGMVFYWLLVVAVNFGIPPSMSMMSEILVIISALKLSILLISEMMIISFFCAFYSLYMFMFINHGKMLMLKSVKMVSLREYMIIMFHMIYLFLYLLKMELFMIY